MSRLISIPLCISALLCSAIMIATPAQAVLVSGTQVLDGYANPFAGQGVTLTPENPVDPSEPRTYFFPDGLQFQSGAIIKINNWPSGATPEVVDGGGAVFTGDPYRTPPLNFDFGSSGIAWDDNASGIDLHYGDRRGPREMTFNMNGNDITGPEGSGTMFNGASRFPVGDYRGGLKNVTVNDVNDFMVADYDGTRTDARGGDLTINATGTVELPSFIGSDLTDSGPRGADLEINASSIIIGDVDTRLNRAFPGDPAEGHTNGDVTLNALAPPDYDPNDEEANDAADNVITLNGLINTAGASPDTTGGNISITAVKVVLDPGFDTETTQGVVTIRAGETGGGFTEADLFMDNAGSGETAIFDVAHTSTPPLTVGDMDCDGDVDFDDIDDFVLGLNDPEEYENQFGVPPSAKGDTDGDGDQDFDDITNFVNILTGGVGDANLATIPEPSTFMIVVLAGICLIASRPLRRS